MSPRDQLRSILDRLALQVGDRLPVEPWGGKAEKVDLGQLGPLASIARDLAAAERDYAALPVPIDPDPVAIQE